MKTSEPLVHHAALTPDPRPRGALLLLKAVGGRTFTDGGKVPEHRQTHDLPISPPSARAFKLQNTPGVFYVKAGHPCGSSFRWTP